MFLGRDQRLRSVAQVSTARLQRLACRAVRRNHVVLDQRTELVPVASLRPDVPSLTSRHRCIACRLPKVRCAPVR